MIVKNVKRGNLVHLHVYHVFHVILVNIKMKMVNSVVKFARQGYFKTKQSKRIASIVLLGFLLELKEVFNVLLVYQVFTQLEYHRECVNRAQEVTYKNYALLSSALFVEWENINISKIVSCVAPVNILLKLVL